MTTMKALPILLALLVTTSALFGQSVEQREFDQLKQRRASTGAGRSAMRDQQYRWSLESLLRRLPEGTQPELRKLIVAELQATAGAQAAAAAMATPAPAAAPTGRRVTKAEMEKLFANSEWRVFPQGGRQTTTIIFLKDGTCTGWGAINFWEVKAPDMLKLSHYNPDKIRNAEFFAFRIDFDRKTAVADMTLGGATTDRGRIEYERPFNRKK
jgi:hypothetical protein